MYVVLLYCAYYSSISFERVSVTFAVQNSNHAALKMRCSWLERLSRLLRGRNFKRCSSSLQEGEIPSCQDLQGTCVEDSPAATPQPINRIRQSLLNSSTNSSQAAIHKDSLPVDERRVQPDLFQGAQPSPTPTPDSSPVSPRTPNVAVIEPCIAFTHEGGSGHRHKENQDAWFVSQLSPSVLVCGVLDGHGRKHGKLAAKVWHGPSFPHHRGVCSM